MPNVDEMDFNGDSVTEETGQSEKTDESKEEKETKVTKEETKQVEHTFTLNYLLKQKQAIEDQKAREIAQRDLELKEVNDLITKCNELGIKEVVEEYEAIKEVK